MNAIFHYGSCVEEGHYISMCREGTSWIEIDDVQVIKKQRPRGTKDISILYLQKKYYQKYIISNIYLRCRLRMWKKLLMFL
ncbi:hypothetical protein ALC57_18103 [Trachymyrmex cornetzi]|uniref:USP domain-containing protein n=1 Tax=Trachymyrmex cornetzi TaxID=471704 RepID=A0A151ISG4_9HYME|nr:hypothetical protein ALC57_18103 [Trachymyrmex cornetzi]